MKRAKTKPVRFGVIGAAGIGTEHLRQLHKLCQKGYARIEAVMDRCDQVAQVAARQYQCAAYKDVQEMLKQKDIDVVSICAPSGLHGELTELAAKAGKHVVVEKPMEISIAKAEEMVRICEAEGVLLSVIYQNRFAEDVQLLRSLLAQGTLGKPVMINGAVQWYRTQEYYDSSVWRGTWALDGGGAVMNQGIHTVDLMLYLFGEYSSVKGQIATLGHERIEVEDTAVSIVEFQSGSLGVLSTTTCAYPGYHVRIEVIGSKGTAKLEDNQLVSLNTTDGLTLDQLKQKTMSDELNLHGRQYLQMIKAINGEERLYVDGKEGLRALYLIDELYKGRITCNEQMV
ncbi:Gfo/Idh/MocA family protein [Pontibacillus salicampi]|uniref:Gfo/Idh/MocA family protein n=1 Tax=Pontibacillus salicampi TaxID=1449801 RepID=A0ABV6LU88_9BACI